MNIHDKQEPVGELIQLMTRLELRDYFAAKALQGLLASDEHSDPEETSEQFQNRMADVSYEYADAMMEARNK